MKATLRFESPVEKDSFKMASDAYEYWVALYDIKNYIRSVEKYEVDNGDQEKILQTIKDFISETEMDKIP